MKQPIIALTPLIDAKQERWYMKPDYMRSVIRAGGRTASSRNREMNRSVAEYLKDFGE